MGKDVFAFDVSMLIILLTIVLLYSVHARRENSLKGAAGNSISILRIVCTVYLIAILSLLFNFTDYVILINVLAVLAGAFLPFFIRGNFDKSIINFPHLVERFELLTIITFGEAIVGLTHFFDVSISSGSHPIVFNNLDNVWVICRSNSSSDGPPKG